MQAISYADAHVNVNPFPLWRQSRGPNLLYSHTVKGIQQTPWEAIYFCVQKNQLAYTTGYYLPGDFLFLLETRVGKSLTNSEEVNASPSRK